MNRFTSAAGIIVFWLASLSAQSAEGDAQKSEDSQRIPTSQVVIKEKPDPEKRREVSGTEINATCDYLLGYFEFVRVHARKSPSADWVPIHLKPVENRAYIGVLLCSLNDTLRPGREMGPNETSASYNRSIRYTFDVDLRSYAFPSGWEGPIECKISQTIFGGRHEDDYEGTIESPAFTVKLPFAKENMVDDHAQPNKRLQRTGTSVTLIESSPPAQLSPGR